MDYKIGNILNVVVLKCSGIEYDVVEKKDNGSVKFVYADEKVSSIKEILNKHYHSKLNINSKLFISEYETIKEMLKYV